MKLISTTHTYSCLRCLCHRFRPNKYSNLESLLTNNVEVSSIQHYPLLPTCISLPPSQLAIHDFGPVWIVCELFELIKHLLYIIWVELDSGILKIYADFRRSPKISWNSGILGGVVFLLVRFPLNQNGPYILASRLQILWHI